MKKQLEQIRKKEKEWRCVIPLEPIGKGRPRVAMRGGFPKAYTPPKTAQWERSASLVLKAHWRRPAITEPVKIEFWAYRKRPKAMCTKSKIGIELCDRKPDIDNIAKCILDSLVVAGVLADDNIVVDLIAHKRWAQPGDRGSVDLLVTLP